MDKDHRFPFVLDFEGKQIKGSVTPSEVLNKEGTPVFFRVELSGEFFAYLCCAENGWFDRDESGKPKDLVQAVGRVIHQFYA